MTLNALIMPHIYENFSVCDTYEQPVAHSVLFCVQTFDVAQNTLAAIAVMFNQPPHRAVGVSCLAITSLQGRGQVSDSYLYSIILTF